MTFHRTRIAALAAATILSLGAPALAGQASPQGNPHGAAPGQSNPAQPGAGTQNNPNGQMPIGQPSPDAKRGNELGRPSPLPSALPSVVPSLKPPVIPSVVPSTLPRTVPPSVGQAEREHAALHGTVTSVTGTTAIVKLANGTSQTYTVSAKTAAKLKLHVGKKIAFRVKNGLLLIGGK